ncbi:hypothetical protein LBMAG27_21460 [Bacteroidota bacterium]|nr:hypothetical protein LBMAG27_21460 [Bacteroidota bacterium]
MKQLFQLVLMFSFMTVACCSEKIAGNSGSTNEKVKHKGETMGKVSHQYRSTGCSTVVIVNWQKPDWQMVLIPIDTLAPDYDIDGLEIYFNYQPLKRMNPPGCSVGFPAILSDISKK